MSSCKLMISFGLLILYVFILHVCCGLREPLLCDRYYNGNSGILTHPNYPFNYTDNRKCLYRIYIHPSTTPQSVCFTFRRFQLAHSEGCFDDYLDFPGVGKYCGNGTLNGAAPTLELTSNIFSDPLCVSVTSGRGYDLRFSSMDLSTNLGFYADFIVVESTSLPLPSIGESSSSKVAPCDSDFFTCFNRKCIPNSEKCDSKDQCGDGSDESYSHARCPGQQDIEACSFEHNMCQFEGIDWMRSDFTEYGPTFDNTFRTNDGSFLYADVEDGDVAYIKYLPVPLSYKAELIHSSSDSSYCLSFWYYMSGYVGRLSLYVAGQDLNRTLVWFRDGHQGSSWIQAEVKIESKYFPLQEVTFEARKNGMNNKNNIAIDDISLLPGSCFGDDVSCTFELGFCDWRPFITTDTKLHAQWKRNHGLTRISNTGPKADRFGGDGFYIYLDASSYSVGDKARLVSRSFSISLSGTVCLQFWYYMFGTGMGELTVYTVDYSGLARKIWEDPSKHVDSWQAGFVAISGGGGAMGSFKIIFEALRGLSSTANIALDDIVLVPGYCQQGPMKPSKPTFIPGSNFTTAECGIGTFQCSYDHACIDESLICNGQDDCSDRSDEVACPSLPRTGGGLHYGGSYGIATGTIVGVSIASIGIFAVILAFIFFVVIRRRSSLPYRRRCRRLYSNRSEDELVPKPPPYNYSPPSYILDPPPYTATDPAGMEARNKLNQVEIPPKAPETPQVNDSREMEDLH